MLPRSVSDVAPRPAPAKAGAFKLDGPIDHALLAVTMLLVAFGVVMVYSASAVYAGHMHHDAQYYRIRNHLVDFLVARSKDLSHGRAPAQPVQVSPGLDAADEQPRPVISNPTPLRRVS